MELDATHLKMLECLRENARVPMSSLAEQLGISRANAYSRFEALTSKGVIEGFHARIDPAAVGHSVGALVFVLLRQSQWADFRNRLDSVSELEYFAVTSGEYDAMLLVRAADVARIHHLVAMKISQWPSVRSCVTVFLMDEQFSDPTLVYPASNVDAGHFGNQPIGMTRFVHTPARGPLRTAGDPVRSPAKRAARPAGKTSSK